MFHDLLFDLNAKRDDVAFVQAGYHFGIQFVLRADLDILECESVFVDEEGNLKCFQNPALRKMENTETIGYLPNGWQFNMISPAAKTDKPQIADITARAGVFSQEEIDSVPMMFDEFLEQGAEDSGYSFIVYRESEQVLGYAIYGYRDLTDGVYDLYWIAVDPAARRKGVGRTLLNACEEAVREAGGRMLIAETSGTEKYEETRAFYIRTGYVNEATIRDFYSVGDDLKIYVKRVR